MLCVLFSERKMTSAKVHKNKHKSSIIFFYLFVFKRILGKWPNTYTLTKALAEDLVKNECAGMPVCVFRPAIITSTAEEPIKGWIDNLYGPTGVG